MVKLLSRCQSPEELFSIISKENFIKAWPKLKRYWVRVNKETDFRDWWQTIYEEILKSQGKGKKNITLETLARICKCLDYELVIDKHVSNGD